MASFSATPVPPVMHQIVTVLAQVAKVPLRQTVRVTKTTADTIVATFDSDKTFSENARAMYRACGYDEAAILIQIKLYKALQALGADDAMVNHIAPLYGRN